MPPIPQESKSFWKMPPGIESFFAIAGGLASFTARFFKEVWFPPYELKEVVRQGYNLGYSSLSLVGITGFIMGLVLTMQSQPTLAVFGAEAWLPAMVTISVIREMGPVITALICAGKVGSGIGAELGSMKVTEQIDAMEVSGTNPFKFIVATRVLAVTVTLPILVFYADAIAIFGAYIGVNITGEVSSTLFINQALRSLDWIDIIPSTIKTIFFGFGIGIVGSYMGYHATKGTAGVGQAANSAVVISSLLVFIIDMVAVQVTQIFM
ncbi:MAG: ABC transporter permease [Chitinophagales bacterium]|nr:ABC transporter permease [Chitinophagales bacterium]